VFDARTRVRRVQRADLQAGPNQRAVLLPDHLVAVRSRLSSSRSWLSAPASSSRCDNSAPVRHGRHDPATSRLSIRRSRRAVGADGNLSLLKTRIDIDLTGFPVSAWNRVCQPRPAQRRASGQLRLSALPQELHDQSELACSTGSIERTIPGWAPIMARSPTSSTRSGVRCRSRAPRRRDATHSDTGSQTCARHHTALSGKRSSAIVAWALHVRRRSTRWERSWRRSADRCRESHFCLESLGHIWDSHLQN
jgi:hypothetical protein